jgi:hypothetical protein
MPGDLADSVMANTLARAFRWRKLLEAGVYGTIEEIAVAAIPPTSAGCCG